MHERQTDSFGEPSLGGSWGLGCQWFAGSFLTLASKNRWLWGLAGKCGRNVVSHPRSGRLSTWRPRASFPRQFPGASRLCAREWVSVSTWSRCPHGDMRRDYLSWLRGGRTSIAHATLHRYPFKENVRKKQFTQISLMPLTRQCAGHGARANPPGLPSLYLITALGGLVGLQQRDGGAGGLAQGQHAPPLWSA